MASKPSTRIPSQRAMMAALAFASAAIASAPVDAAPTGASSGYVSSQSAWDVQFEAWKRTLTVAEEHNFSDAFSDAEGVAWTKLINMPAPNAEALLWKMDYLWGGHGPGNLTDAWSRDIVSVVMKDAHRLLGGLA